jgi:hypothetical protein
VARWQQLHPCNGDQSARDVAQEDAIGANRKGPMPKLTFSNWDLMYSRKLLLSAILICLVLPLAGLSTLNEPADAAVSSAISSELRGMAAKGQLGNNLSTTGYRESTNMRLCGSKAISQHHKQRIWLRLYAQAA